MSQLLQFVRNRRLRLHTASPATVIAALVVLAGAGACRTPYRYPYEKPTGVGLTDRATDYCHRAAVQQGYTTVRETGPNTVDSPTQVDVRMRVANGVGDIIVSCAFDDAKRVAVIPRLERGGSNKGDAGYRSADAKAARQVCDRAVRSSGYDARSISVAQWMGARDYRVNVSVRQGGGDRTVGCRYDGVAGTASVPPVTK